MKGRVLRGNGISPGIAIGKALVLKSRRIPVIRRSIQEEDIPLELKKLKEALSRSKRQLIDLKKRFSQEGGGIPVCIFDSHLMMLEDPVFIAEVERVIKESRVNVEWAIRLVIDDIIAAFSSIEDEFFRDRKVDIEDVGNRLLLNLSSSPFFQSKMSLSEEVIVIAPNLTPSDLAHLAPRFLLGFATDTGGATSHTGIIARSRKIPAVVGVNGVTSEVRTGDRVIIDGDEGVVIVEPTEVLIKEYRVKQLQLRDYEARLFRTKELEAVTTDGVKVTLQANIDLPEEVDAAIAYGAEGIGLYRSEFLFLKPGFEPPTEEEHFQVYRELTEKVSPHPAIVRTLDLGGEKLSDREGAPDEANPVLGLRAIRYCLKRRDLFKTQLRALLRASAYGDIRVVFPLISGLEELREVKEIFSEAKEELKREGVPINEDMPLGVMIEVPSAAATADILAMEADFFSIGTNDLVQYFLAVDRTNMAVSHLYQPLHPAILRSVKFVVEAAKKAEIEVNICGEIAADPILVMVLLGMGLTQLSMNPASIPLIKNVIRSVSLSEAEEIARRVLTFSTAKEIEEYLLERMASRFSGRVLTELRNNHRGGGNGLSGDKKG
ncbi:MAG: phosphoenolpyruvate--protein phosphotransferase [Acidobacteria bacterium]|nr:phosphoenolpyruvate--protein phosphotransferase [Acidobacteriota bacterium]